MKSSIILILTALPIIVSAQIKLEGAPISIDSINSPDGQNFMVLDPNTNKMAFTQERGGVGSFAIKKKNIDIDSAEWEVAILPDYLGENGMASPLGFLGKDLVYSTVEYSQGIYRSKIYRENNQGQPVEITIPFFKNKSPIQSGCISANGKYMILSAESNNTKGVEDLYVSIKQANGNWSSLKNLGSQINTEFQEITPFLAPDNRTLFFATNGRGGEGSFDIFYAVRQGEFWNQWSEPVNLGQTINTSGAETSFAFQDGAQWAYYVSSQDSDGYGDVLRIKISEEIESEREEEPLPTLDQVVNEGIMIKVMDQRTRELITSELIFDTLEVFVPGGIFMLDSTYLTYSDVEVKSEGYLPKLFPLGDDLIVGVNEITLDRVEAGKTFTLEDVLFHRGTANLIDGTESEIDLVIEMMNDNPNVKILLKGHTDNQGDPVKNVELSEERVKAVKAYIVARGISPYRIRGRGYGGNQPIASNETESTRKLNRRVEFEVVED